MRLVCAWCADEGRPAFLSEKEPYDNPSETHGICPHHYAAVQRELAGRVERSGRDGEAFRRRAADA